MLFIFMQNTWMCTPSIHLPDLHPGELLQGIGEIQFNPDTKLPVFPAELIFSVYGRYYLKYSCRNATVETMRLIGAPIDYLPRDYAEQKENLQVDVMKEVQFLFVFF